MILAAGSLFIAHLVSPSATPVSVSVKDIEGKNHTIPIKGKKATVLIFVGTDCPIANRLAPEMARINTAYSVNGVAFCFVYPDRETKAAAVRAHRKEYGLGGLAFIDRDRTLVKMGHALVTPQAAIILPSGGLVYSGRINNLWPDQHKPLAKATRHELRKALDDVVAGRPVSVEAMPAVGCAIGP